MVIEGDVMKYWKPMLLILILLLSFFLRAPFFSQPLDNDEATYAFFSFFSKEGRFYSSLQIGRLPGIIFTYRILDNLFPGQIVAFRVVSALLIVLATFVIYKLGKLLFDERVGILSSLIFAIFSSQISTDSPANTEFFMMPFMVISVYFFWVFLKSRKLFWLFSSGLSAGIALFYKQVAVFEVGFLGLWLLVESFKKGKLSLKLLLRRWSTFGVSALILFAITVAFFYLRGELGDFWWQSFGSGGPYVKYAWEGWGWFDRLKNAARYLWGAFWPLWLLGFGGLIIALLERKKRPDLFLIGWLLFSLIGVFFNGWFFAHYFVQVIPAISLLGGFFIGRAFEYEKFRLPLTLSVILTFSLVIGNRLSVYTNYFRFLQGGIDKIEYFKRLGVDTGDAGWLPLYDSAAYLRNFMIEEDTLFVWSTTPLPYYLTRKYPTTSFVKSYPLLNYKFMLPTWKGWKFDFETNRQKLIRELAASPPTYILIDVNPMQIYDQMILFKDFSSFIGRNYNFEKGFSRTLIFKVGGEGDTDRVIGSDSSEIPLDLIRRFSAISEVKIEKGQTNIVFEPMVNPGGVLRSLEITYSGSINIDFEPISAEFLGQDGSDFVGNAAFEPSGNIDLHIRVEGPSKPASFVRVKTGDKIWNNRHYGVNPPLRVTQHDNIFDLYFEPPSNWGGKEFEVYFVYEDGSLAKERVGA